MATDDLNQRLVSAVRAADPDGVRRALGEGANPSTAMGPYRGSILELAVTTGSTAVVQLLLDSGAHIGPSGDRRASPLGSAVLGSHIDIVRSLLARGALALEVRRRGGVLGNALAAAGHRPTATTLEILRMLLAAGASAGSAEEAPLVTAVMGRTAPAVLRILLEHGADADQRRSDGVPVLILAARRGDAAAVDLLINAGATMDARDLSGRTALMHAVERNQRQCTAVLLLAGANVAASTDDGTTALLLARGWLRQSIQFLLGEHSVGREVVPIVRSTVRLIATSVRLAGDPAQLSLFADVIETALADLGDDEWATRRGIPAEAARRFAIRLRDDAVASAVGSWHQLDATMEEYHVLRGALAELAFGTTTTMPRGCTRWQLIDLLADVEAGIEA